MKDYKIYIFTVISYGIEDLTIAQVYAKDFFEAWNLVEYYNPGYVEIDFIAFEDTTQPENWGQYTNQIRLSN